MKGTDRYRVRDVTCRMGGEVFPVVNMSVSGFFVDAAKPPPEGTSLEVQLQLPGHEPITLLCDVAWINSARSPSRKELPGGCGLRMARIDFTDKMRVLAFLRQSDPASLRDR